MAAIDRDKELVEAEVGKILGRHRSWLEENFRTESIWEILNRSSQIYDRILGLALPVFGVGITDQVCLVAVGSYGREEVCPYSDLDLLILYRELPLRKIEDFSARLLGLLWDQKITVGHSLRTKEQCLKLAEKENSVLTALLDARPVAGNLELFRELTAGFEKVAQRLRKSYFFEKYDELTARRIKHKNVIWVTEPQVMEGVGGLRDWHLVRWLSRACLGLSGAEQLEKSGILEAAELKKIHQGLGRLFRARAALHLLSGKKLDLISIDLQDQLARALEIKSDQYPLAADAFLAWLFSGAEPVAAALDRLLFELNGRFRPAKPGPVEGISWLEQNQGYLSVKEREMKRVFAAEPEIAVSLLKCAARSGLSLAPLTKARLQEKVSRAAKSLRPHLRELFAPDMKTSAAIREFKDLDLLQNLFPELYHAFYLGQRDGYHNFTVGWHSVLCLEKIEEMEQEPEFGDDPEINWPALKLSALTHDLGKGSGGEHQLAGARIGLMVAERLKLDAESAELMEFLIEEHLLLNHYAYRRDFYEPRAVEFLVAKIKHSSRLKMMFMLTCADIKAVADTSWTKWKEDLLRRLYHMLLAQLERKETPSKQLSDRLKTLKQMMLEKGMAQSWAAELEKLPTRYLLGAAPEKIIEEMQMIEARPPAETRLRTRLLEKPRLEVAVVCDDRPGLFSELSGVMSSLNYNILSAEINTIRSTVLDIFVVEDLVAARSEHWEQEAERRSARLEQTLVQAAAGSISVEELVAKKKGIFRPKTRLEIQPEVHFDQESSDSYTILEVSAQDQPGLLYKITRGIFQHGLDIQFAKISTRAEKVFDVFYLREPKRKGKARDEEAAKLTKSLLLSLKSGAAQKI